MSVAYISIVFDKRASLYIGELLGFTGAFTQGAGFKELLQNLAEVIELIDSQRGEALSVYFDLDYPDPEEMARKSILVASLLETLRDEKLDEIAVAALLGIDLQDFRNVLRGMFRNTSESTLQLWIRKVSTGKLILVAEAEAEEDGRWLAEVSDLAALAYGKTPLDAITAAIRSGAVTLEDSDFETMLAQAKLVPPTDSWPEDELKGQVQADPLVGAASSIDPRQGQVVIGHVTPAGANIFSELGSGPREASDLLKASNQAIAAKLAAPIADPDGSSVQESEAEFLIHRNNVSDGELAARVRSAPDMGSSMLVELSTFVQKRAYRFKRYQDSELLERGRILKDMASLAASGFGMEGHYALLNVEGPPKENDMVELIAASPAGQPVGILGVVLRVYPNNEAYEVEFQNAAGYSVETIAFPTCRAVVLVNALLKRWASALSQKLDRSEGSIMKDGLAATDFPGTAVRIVFEDESNLHFENAFFLGDIANRTKDKTICRAAVFTEHNGYHEFWVGPDDRIDVVDGGSQIVVTDRESLRLMELMENPPPYNKELLQARIANFAKLLKDFKPEVHGGEFPHGAISHEEATIQEFQADPQQAADYLGEVAGDGEPDEVVLALRRISAAFDTKDEVELTRDFKQTVAARVERDPAFAIALLDEAKALFQSGESKVARGVLRALFATPG